MSSIAILTRLRQVQQEADATFAEKVAGITLRQFMVLETIGRLGPMTQTEIVDETGIDRSTLSGLLARLARDELVAVAEGTHDKRVNFVSLTATGRARLEAAQDAARSVAQSVRKSLRGIGGKRSAA